MGVLPCNSRTTIDGSRLGIRGDELFDVELASETRPEQDATLVIRGSDGMQRRVSLVLRIDGHRGGLLQAPAGFCRSC